MSGYTDNGQQCPTHNLTARANKTLIADLTFQEFNCILAGTCTALACLASFIQMWRHATHLSVPRQQVKVIRVILLVPLSSIFNLLYICFPQLRVYLDPILELIQALCHTSYFMLLCEYISPYIKGRDGFFSQIEIKDKEAKDGVQDGVKWFAQRCFLIFQYPVITLGVAITTIITEVAGLYCQYVNKSNFAKLWLNIAMAISSTLGIGAVVIVAVQLKTYMPDLNPMAKLLVIQLVVGLAFLQRTAFWILQSIGVIIKETDTVTYADLHYGILALLSCIEMVPISFLLFWAYPVGPYKLENLIVRGSERGESQTWAPTSYQGGVFGIHALFSMINPLDIIKATFAAFAVGIRDYAFAKFTHEQAHLLFSKR